MRTNDVTHQMLPKFEKEHNMFVLSTIVLGLWTLYLYWLMRVAILAFAQRNHSKSVIKKLWRTAPRRKRIFGTYLLQNPLNEKWLKPTLCFANITLLDIPMLSIACLLALLAVYPEAYYYKLFVACMGKDGVIWILLFIFLHIA